VGRVRPLLAPLVAALIIAGAIPVATFAAEPNVDHWWDLDVSGPDAQDQLLRGPYADVQRYPFHNPAEDGLHFSGDGRGCNELDATFAVDEVSYDADGLLSVSVRFRQRCGSSSALLFGAFRWGRNAGGPTFTSPPG
jgi:hypothetical protein